MASIFPGMDPYLEQEGTWSDFHTTFFMTIRKRLNATLPPGFVARIDRYIWIHEPEAKDRILLGKPDVYVAESGHDKKGEKVGALVKRLRLRSCRRFAGKGNVILRSSIFSSGESSRSWKS